MKEPMIMINLRLPKEYVEKIKVLRQAGFLPSTIMRASVVKAIDEKIAIARKIGALNDDKYNFR